MEIIRDTSPDDGAGAIRTRITVERRTLAKRRWRGTAEDRREFGFDLVAPMVHGAVFTSADGKRYVVEQKPEPVLAVKLIPRAAPVARLGWTIGNLHFPIEVTDDFIRVPDDPALRQLFEREKIPFTTAEHVFQPFARAHSHAG